jgi:hypothetical protein
VATRAGLEVLVDGYPAIEDHGLIGSPSVFAALVHDG